MLRFLLLFACLATVGCSSNAGRIDALARASSLERHVLAFDDFRTVTYLKPVAQAEQTVVILLEGDGRPWRAGIEPNEDPTTSNPLALALLTRTPRPGGYVSRPCYQGKTERCSPALWTSARYSEEIVDVMARAIGELVHRLRASKTILVGYSGGGTLAVLIAERMGGITAVVTIGANLDTDAWTEHHGYLPLSQSLNPARSVLPHPWREIHIAGQADRVVPIQTASAYFERHPSAERWVLAGHSHVCCWLDEWPALWERLELALDLRDE